MSSDLRAPRQLIDKIRRGQCVAFVGSGFTAPVVGTWDVLLRDLALDLEDEQVVALLDSSKHPGSDLLEAAAQMLRDPDEARFYSALRERLANLEDHSRWPMLGVAEVRAPVIVFATNFKENRRRALRAGAREYTYRNDELFREIEQLFGD